MGPFSREQILGFIKNKKITPSSSVGTTAEGPFQPLATVWDDIASNPRDANRPAPPKQFSIPPLPGSTGTEAQRTPVSKPDVVEIAPLQSTKIPPLSPKRTDRNQKQKAILIASVCVVSLLLAGLCFVVIRFSNEIVTQAGQSEKDEVSSDSTNAEMQLALGLMHASGDGVSQDFTEDLKWFLAAAEQGNARAQYFLGLSYAEGNGVAEDKVQAMKWL